MVGKDVQDCVFAYQGFHSFMCDGAFLDFCFDDGSKSTKYKFAINLQDVSKQMHASDFETHTDPIADG